MLDYYSSRAIAWIRYKESLGITLGRSPAGNGVGTYTISKNSQTSRNYAVNMPNGTYTISPKPITLVVENKESAYSSKQSLSVKLDDGHTLVSGDNLEMLKVLYSPIMILMLENIHWHIKAVKRAQIIL